MITKVTFRGTGQLNGPVIIDKTLELDEKSLRPFYGAKKDEVMTAFLANHYPGVEINPRKVSIIQEKVTRTKSAKPRITTSKSKKETKSFGLMSIVFLPFKIIWKIIKFLTKGNHY